MIESVANQLGIDPEKMAWQDWAACHGLPFESGQHPFFERYESEGPTYKRAMDSLCNGCPVQKICGDYASERKEEGLWGGIYWTSTGRVDKKRNEHKTDDDWKHLSKVYGRRMKPTEQP